MGSNRVYIYSDPSCKTVEGRWVGYRRLNELYKLSDGKYELTESPELADIILYGDVLEERWTKKILSNNVLKKYASKSFSISWHWRPFFLSHGIYINNRKSIWTYGRTRTGSYTLMHETHKNPYIESHKPSARDYAGKQLLLSFIGRASCKTRTHIFNMKFKRSDILVEDSSSFQLWDNPNNDKNERQKYFFDTLMASKFSLCPRGSGPNSIRLFESMQLGIAPVIISDEWKFPNGPDWNEFSIIIKEKDINRMEAIIESHEHKYEEMGRKARQVYEEYFSERVYFNYIISCCFDIIKNQLIHEALYWRLGLFSYKLRVIASKIRAEIRFRSRIRAFIKKREGNK